MVKHEVVIPTEEFKLKHEAKKDQKMFDLQKTFGFIPRRIIIKLSPSRNNTFVLGAVDEEAVTVLAQQTLKQIKQSQKGKGGVANENR